MIYEFNKIALYKAKFLSVTSGYCQVSRDGGECCVTTLFNKLSSLP